jgi:heterodisulfide reductase subunit C
MVIKDTGILRTGSFDTDFVKEVKDAGGKNITKCYQCGTCVGFCPGGMTTSFRTRKVIRKAVMGRKDEVLASRDIWFCTTCYTCYERCPRGVNPTDVIIAIRNIAAREGLVPENFKKSARNLLSTGHIVPLQEPIKKNREELGLDPEPPTTLVSMKALEEVKKIADVVGTKELLGLEE